MGPRSRSSLRETAWKEPGPFCPACLRNGWSGAHLLDLGCGTGNMLLAAAEAGVASAAGIDSDLREFGHNLLDDLAAKEGISTQAISLAEGNFCSYSAGRKFDIITCFDVLEHVIEPRPFLENMRRHLAPGGMAIIDISPLYFSQLGHHLFSYFPREKMPWAHLYKDFEELLAANPLDEWTRVRFGELNRMTSSQLRTLTAETGFEIVAEHGCRTGEDVLDQYRDRLRWDLIPAEEDLFHEWCRLDLTLATSGLAGVGG